MRRLFEGGAYSSKYGTHYAIAFTVNSLAHKISDKMHHKTLKHPLPQSLVYMINDDIQRKNATYLPAQPPAHKINDKKITLT